MILFVTIIIAATARPNVISYGKKIVLILCFKTEKKKTYHEMYIIQYHKLHQQYKYIVAHCLMLMLHEYFRQYCHSHFTKSQNRNASLKPS